ncbi:hypothetical protein [Nocardioides yefusunii]|uniref:Monooxygenase n=1 Tax=Nocardioides yefusunii TaxID=2500546 RepID=A0ABW1QVT9_9ACTN|nr:hypothetical protein [Nocardioides yefusunii]
MRGLSVRWSLTGAGADTADALRDYVAEASHAKFTGMQGLRFKTWRMREGEWFEGTYVFATAEARASFQETFTAAAATAPVSEMTGGAPEFIEEFEVVAIAEGWDGFESSARG